MVDLKLRFSHLTPQMNNTPYQSPYLSQPPHKEPSRVAKAVDMSYEGVDLTAEANQGFASISWQLVTMHLLFYVAIDTKQ